MIIILDNIMIELWGINDQCLDRDPKKSLKGTLKAFEEFLESLQIDHKMSKKALCLELNT